MIVAQLVFVHSDALVSTVCPMLVTCHRRHYSHLHQHSMHAHSHARPTAQPLPPCAIRRRLTELSTHSCNSPSLAARTLGHIQVHRKDLPPFALSSAVLRLRSLPPHQCPPSTPGKQRPSLRSSCGSLQGWPRTPFRTPPHQWEAPSRRQSQERSCEGERGLVKESVSLRGGRRVAPSKRRTIATQQYAHITRIRTYNNHRGLV